MHVETESRWLLFLPYLKDQHLSGERRWHLRHGGPWSEQIPVLLPYIGPAIRSRFIVEAGELRMNCRWQGARAMGLPRVREAK